CYTTPNKELRLICRRYFWHYEGKNQVITRDGYRLVRVWWESNSFQSQVLDEFTTDIQNGAGLYWVGTLLNNQDKHSWIGATLINSDVWATNLTIYDISHDRLEKKFVTRKDEIIKILSFNRSINSDSIPEWCIIGPAANNTHRVHIYSGDVQNSLKEFTNYVTCPYLSSASIGDRNGEHINDLVVSRETSFTKTCFAILKNDTSLLSVSELISQQTNLLITLVSPMPVSKDKTLQLKVSVPQTGNYTLSFYDILGMKLPSKSAERFQLSGEQILFVNIGDYAVSSGVYTLRLEGGQGLVAQCSVVIE
ncbi:MAG: hypothetical protein JST20_05225, partial [Bacteroidetes bacterium]|nr:hypothetical protein [Bacteroidota bacterium]